jgi:hypothetical protein
MATNVDAGHPYVTKAIDLTDNEAKVVKFIEDVEPTGGGDAPECYELVLHEARSLSWKSGRSKVLCMMGDDVPHGPTYPMNTKRLDWRNELGLLLESNINVYGVQCLNRGHATSFWREIAEKTGGFHLSLDQFANIVEIIMAVCFKQDSAEKLRSFESEVRSRGKMNRNVDAIFATLLGREKAKEFKSADLTAVPPGRFQVLEVDADTPIKDFVEHHGLKFKKGRGWYEFMKPEEVQDYKEVILMDRRSGDCFSGKRARELLGLPLHGTIKIKPEKSKLDQYLIFIQSTSANRKLIAVPL